jgi:acyl-coenzyme A synthetase/AMP-(fatty) acid ligase
MMPLNFSAGLKYALTALLNGVMQISFNTLIKGIAPFSEWLDNEGITILIPPVGFFRRFLDTIQNDAAFPACKCVILNDKIYTRDVEKFRRVFGPDCDLIYVFGSTETGGIARYRIDDTTLISDPIPVGSPVDDIEVRIVNAQGQRRPNGRTGEVVVVGSYLPPGYWKDPSLTEQKYKNVPGDVLGEEPKRMYLTGDTGAIGEDGLLYLYGRKDNQVKIRGYRVDLSEIESVLNNIRGVAHAVVTASENSIGEKELNAYVSLSGQETLNTTMLREIFVTKLPDYMLPNIVIIDEMPTNSPGKVDRQELTTIEIPVKEETGRTSETETERRLVELWESVFEINGIKPADDILDLGVGSLQVMVMCLKANEIFSIDVPYSQILMTPTIAEFSVYIETEVKNREGIPAVSA